MQGRQRAHTFAHTCAGWPHRSRWAGGRLCARRRLPDEEAVRVRAHWQGGWGLRACLHSCLGIHNQHAKATKPSTCLHYWRWSFKRGQGTGRRHLFHSPSGAAVCCASNTSLHVPAPKESDGAFTQGADTSTQTQGADTSTQTQGADTSTQTQGADTSTQTQGADTSTQTQGADTGTQTQAHRHKHTDTAVLNLAHAHTQHGHSAPPRVRGYFQKQRMPEQA
eukprot:1160653-Pelagomonas_calceolata.AAC.9